MKSKRNKRLLTLVAFFVPVCLGVVFLMLALKENISYFYTPTDIAQHIVPVERDFRLGGLVKTGSIEKITGTTKTRFVVTDGENSFPIVFDGILPDLFREEQGVIADGKITDDVFMARRILAKHDENYRPPEMKEIYRKYEEQQ